jgi:plasmid maintenance system antidote protein VapI
LVFSFAAGADADVELIDYHSRVKERMPNAGKALCVSRTMLSRVIDGQAGASPDIAIRLSKAFGATPDIWIRMQAALRSGASAPA